MVEYTLFEKISMLFNLLLESPLFLIIILGIFLMIIDIKYISKNSKKTMKIYLIIIAVVMVLLIYSYLDSFTNVFDSIAQNIALFFYFPSVLEYITTLIIGLIIVLISIFSKRITKKIKTINITVFGTNILLFFLILDQIASNEVDLNNKISIYTNSNMMILLNLSLLIFIIWLIGLGLYKIIKLLNKKAVLELPVNLDMDEKVEESIDNLMQPQYIDGLFTLEEYHEMKALLEQHKKD